MAKVIVYNVYTQALEIKEESHVCFQLIYKYPSTFVCLS